MNTNDKLDWIRKRWTELKKNNKLESIVQKVIDADDFLKKYTADEIICIEESLPEYLL